MKFQTASAPTVIPAQAGIQTFRAAEIFKSRLKVRDSRFPFSREWRRVRQYSKIIWKFEVLDSRFHGNDEKLREWRRVVGMMRFQTASAHRHSRAGGNPDLGTAAIFIKSSENLEVLDSRFCGNDEKLREWRKITGMTKGAGMTIHNKKTCLKQAGFWIGTPTGIRTPVAAVKGQCPRPLDDGRVKVRYFTRLRKLVKPIA